MRGAWRILASWLILLLLIPGSHSFAQSAQSSKDKTREDQEKEKKKTDMQKILEQLGVKERLPGEDMEAWQRRVMEEYKKEIEAARQDKETLENTFKAFESDLLQKNFSQKVNWLPTADEACYVAQELGLTETPSSKSLARKIMVNYLRDSDIRKRLNTLKLETINIYNEVGAIFLVDAKEIFSVFVWHKTPRGWVLTGVAGGERAYFIQTAQRLRNSIVQAESEANQFVLRLLKAQDVKSYFHPDAAYLMKVWISLQEENYLKDAKIESVHLDADSMDAEVRIQASGEPIILNFLHTKQGYRVINMTTLNYD